MAHFFRFLGAVLAEAVDESIAEYDYENANDVDEFCPDLPNNPDAGNYDEGDMVDAGYFPSQSILPTQTQGKYIIFCHYFFENSNIFCYRSFGFFSVWLLYAIFWLLW